MKKALTLLFLASFILSIGLATAHTSEYDHHQMNHGMFGGTIFGWTIGILLVILLVVLIFYFIKRIENMERKRNSNK